MNSIIFCLEVLLTTPERSSDACQPLSGTFSCEAFVVVVVVVVVVVFGLLVSLPFDLCPHKPPGFSNVTSSC